jgi:hypothetical protein
MDVAIFRVIHGFLAPLILDTEDRDDMFLRNVSPHTDYTVLYLRRVSFSVEGTKSERRIWS